MITYDRLSKIIPPDQALACKAIQVSLQQIKNIDGLSLPQLAGAFSNLETTRDLDSISALTEAVPESVADYYSNQYATGTGPNGTLVLTDLLGAAVGIDYIDQINNCVTTINSMTTSGTLANLITIYTRMQNCVNSVYGNAVTGPVTVPAGFGAGTYGNADDALSNASGLINSAVIEIGNISTADSANVAVLNTAYDNMANKVISENNNLTLASIDVLNLISTDRGPIMSFVQSLPGYGPDTEENGPVWFLESVANTIDIGGQAIIGCLREGRNVAVLNSLNVGQDTVIPSTPSSVPPSANLLPSTYDESEAANLVVR